MKAIRNSQTWDRSGRALTSCETFCETELGSDEDEEDMCYSDPEGPYIDEPIADEEWLNRIQPRTRRNLKEKPGVTKPL